MRPLATALLLLLALPILATETHKKTIVTESIEVEPESLAALQSQSALIVRARVLSSSVRAFPATPTTETSARASWPIVRTEHRIEIIDVYKCGSNNRAKQGVEINILQMAGRYETADNVFVIADEKPFARGGEYVLFLSWNDYFGGYEVYGRFGTFEVVRKRAIPAAEWQPSKGVRSMPIGEFAKRLRVAASRRENE